MNAKPINWPEEGNRLKTPFSGFNSNILSYVKRESFFPVRRRKPSKKSKCAIKLFFHWSSSFLYFFLPFLKRNQPISFLQRSHDMINKNFERKKTKRIAFVFSEVDGRIFRRMHKTQKKNQTLSNCADESFCEEIWGKQVFSSSWDSPERLIWNLSLQSKVLMRLLQKPLWFLSKNNSCTWTVTSLKRSGRSSSVWFIFELLSLASAAEVNKVSN